MNRELLKQCLDLITDLDKEGLILESGLIFALRQELAKPEQEPVAQIRVKNGYWLETPRSIKVKSLPDGLHDLYTAPPRKPWQGMTSEDWENTPNTGKVGCERDAELFDWIEQTLKDKNDTL